MSNEFQDQPTAPREPELEETTPPSSSVSSETPIIESRMPDQVGPWKIDKKIGSGGMGSVYLGIHEETEQQAAVKVLPASLAREPGFIARFNREIESMKLLENPHIVKFIDSGVEDDTYFYTMEFVDGETLTNLIIKQKRIPWEQVVDYTIQICSALKSAHDTGIVHRDLKPSNLLIDRDDQIKLTDFGVAQVIAAGKLTATGGVIGTAEYMSPEQAQGTRASKKSDLYSLGAVMYAMVCGRPPFNGKTTLEVIQKHKFGQFDRPNMYVPDLPIWLNEIICQLLEKEPDRRFPDAYVLSRRLQEKMNQHQQRTQNLTLNGSSSDSFEQTVAGVGLDSNDPNATLMRDLMRAQIEEATAKGPVGEILDNTYVLLMILAIIVLGGIYAIRTSSSSSTFVASQDAEMIVDEPARLLKQADHYRDIGDYQRAHDMLISLDALLTENDSESGLKSKIKTRLARLESADAREQSRKTFVERSLSNAQDAMQRGDHEEARKIYESIIVLYHSDASAEAAVEEASIMLSQLGIDPETVKP